jgi:uncharacterized protein YdbL (DUF1318 family)
MKYVKPLRIAIIGLFLAVFACVTINIYFPAEQVESVAGEIVDEIRGKKGEPEGESRIYENGFRFRKTFLVFSRSVAWAQEVTTVSNPTIRALKERMKDRFKQMKPFFQNGALKEGDDGYVILADTGGLGLKEQRDLKSMVEAENQDRKSLYQEVAKALKIDPGQVDKIAGIFAEEWQKSLR